MNLAAAHPSRMSRILAVIVASFAAILGSFAMIPAASADSPYAFAVQPDGCTPGYVHINHTPGDGWSLDGVPVDVAAPSSVFPFPGGFQGDATADGDEPAVYYLTVNPIPQSCYPPVDPECPVVNPTDDLEQMIADLKIQRAELRTKVGELRATIRQKNHTIARLRAKISRLR